MRKRLFRLSFLAITFTICYSKTKGQVSTKEITDKFFNIYVTDPSKAVDYAFSTNKWFDRKQDDVASAKDKFKNLVSLLGDYYGYEFLVEKSAGANVKMESFLVRYDREPIRITFMFYKPKDTWRMSNFTYDEDLGSDLMEAIKVYRLKENIY